MLSSPKNISLGQLDEMVQDGIGRYLGSYKNVNSVNFEAAFERLLDELLQIVAQNNLSLWKKSRIAGNLEMFVHYNLPKPASKIWARRIRERLYGA